MKMKTCNKCNQTKRLNEFYKVKTPNKAGKIYTQGECKECTKKHHRKYSKNLKYTHPDRYQEKLVRTRIYMRKYYRLKASKIKFNKLCKIPRLKTIKIPGINKRIIIGLIDPDNIDND